MKQVRNTHSGVLSWFPDNPAAWLVKIGKCEYVQEQPDQPIEQEETEKEAKHVAVIKPAKKQPAKVATGD